MSVHSEKKGYQNGTLEVLLLQMAPFFQRGTLFSLIIMFVEKRVWNSGQGSECMEGQIVLLGVLLQYPFFLSVPYLSKAVDNRMLTVLDVHYTPL